MQKIRVPISSFQYGEVSDSLIMRTDTAVYNASAQSLQNMVVMAEGSVKKRYGLKHIYDYGLRYVSSDGTGTADDDGVVTQFTNTGQTSFTLNGAFVSGGQRQRMGLARLFYFNKKIIVLDEATSALDYKTEASILEKIYSLGKEYTIIMISHREETLKNCGVILEFPLK